MPVRRALLLAALVSVAAPAARAFDMMSDPTPHGMLRVPARGSADLLLDINARDFVQWTWRVDGGHEAMLATRVVWSDRAGRERAETALPAGQTFGNFDVPATYAIGRIEWHNSGDEPLLVAWTYSSSASFWRRPEYVLPALLPLFLLAAAFHLGRRIDRRRARHATRSKIGANPPQGKEASS
jgi:hypothetical protein